MSSLKRCLLVPLGRAVLCVAAFHGAGAQQPAASGSAVAAELDPLNWNISTAFRPLQGARPQDPPSEEMLRLAGDDEAGIVQRHGEKSPEHVQWLLRRLYVLLGQQKTDETAARLMEVRRQVSSLLEEGRPPEQRSAAARGLCSILMNAEEELGMRRKDYEKVIQSTQEHLKLLAAFNDPKARGREVRTTLFLLESLMNLRRPAECRPWIKQVVAMLGAKEVMPTDSLAEDVPSVATVAQALEMRDEVAFLQAWGVKMIGEATGLDRGLRVDGLGRIAGLLLERGMLDETETVLMKAYIILKEGKTEAVAGGGMLSVLGRLRLRQNLMKPSAALVDEAEKHFKEAAAMLENGGRTGPRWVAARLSNFANVESARGHLAKAMELRREAWQLLDKDLGPHADETLTAMTNYAEALVQLRRLEEAIQTCRQIVERAQKAYGALDPKVATMLHLQGHLHMTQKEYENAEKCYERAAGIRERALGAEHAETAKSYFNLGLIREAEGDPEGAVAYFEHVLKIDRKAHGDDGAMVMEDTAALARALMSAGKNDEALARVNEQLDVIEKKQGADHPAMCAGLLALATVQQRRERFDEAEQIYEKVIAIRVKALSEEDALVAEGRLLYAFYLISRNKLSMAGRELRMAGASYARHQKRLGTYGAQLRSCLEVYAPLMRKMQHDEATIAKHVRALESGVNPEDGGGAGG